MIQEYEKQHAALVRESAAECTVLLKKDDSFPLAAPCMLLLAGSGVRKTVKGGTGSGEVNSHFFTTIEDGLKNAGFTLCGRDWLDAYDALMRTQADAKRERLRKVFKEQGISGLFLEKDHEEPVPFYDFPLETNADAAVYVIARNSGEGSDRKAERGDFFLTECEVRDIRFLAAHYRKFMLVLNVGGPLDLREILNDVPNLLLLSQLGAPTGDVLADILLGRAVPSGRLTATWAAAEKYPSAEGFGGWDETVYREGIFVGYRYFETYGVKPEFPFGYGLSFTAFSQTCERFALEGQQVSVSVQVSNTGKYAGKEVLQLYVSKPSQLLPQPLVSLAAFGKTALLQPGEKQSVTLPLSMQDLASYDEAAAQYVLEPGKYVFCLGENAQEVHPCGVVEVSERIVVRQVQKIGGGTKLPETELIQTAPDKNVQLLQAAAAEQALPCCRLDPADVPHETASYDLPEISDPVTEQLSDSDLAILCLGHYLPGAAPSMVGNSGRSVCGAAGETTLRLKEKGIDKSLVLADGPAGLRLTPVYAEDETGYFSCDETDIRKMREILPPETAAQYGLGEELDEKMRRSVKRTQYCTAIPIGTAIAQSFSTELAERYADIVGAEMERFGIHLWLAPGMNIHRYPLCGRNFEYYSEDPLLTGEMAAAMTQGVQKHPGRGVTIKHFCCNNQEMRRTKNNAVVSERALREIYLRGFEIAIRKAHPHAVMSSYNLVNGVHTSERYDLITQFLRGECGFDGIVMTDWIGTDYETGDGIYRNGCAAPTMQAGNDLFMPGSEADYQDIMRALSDGTLSRKQLRQNAARVWALMRELN